MEQIIKGWVAIDHEYQIEGEEIFLVKNSLKKVTKEDDGRQLGNLISDALGRLGFDDLTTYEEYDDQRISRKYIAKNLQIKLFASNTRKKLVQIQENAILESMGLLSFQEDWYGYSTFSIEGYSVDTFTLGGHNILEVIEQYEGYFIYLLISKV